MAEQIGNVILDETYYGGADLYSDGDVEDTLLSIVQQHSEEEFPRIIEERESWPVLYHLSRFRENIVNWLPLTKDMKVLEIGSGCGAITGALARRAGSVTCVELSKKRSLINAHRHKEFNNITIKIGNFQDIEPALDTDYDYVFLIGVFEYGQGYIGTDTPYRDFMNIINRHRGSNGRIVIAIENKYGLKYFAGCREDHVGAYFAGIEDYPDGSGTARTFSRDGLIRIMEQCGISDYHFYYPYPDYKFMRTVHSDEYLPHVGELTNNLCNFDRERMVLFDEKNTYDGLIRDGRYADFANSFLVVIGERPAQIYAKFSNDRAPQYAIRTEICTEFRTEIRTEICETDAPCAGAQECKGGDEACKGSVQACRSSVQARRSGDEAGASVTRFVKKYPEGQEASAHVSGMLRTYEQLCAKYEGSGLEINACQADSGGVRFAYVCGETLETALDECLDRNDEEGFLALLTRYEALSRYRENEPVSDYDLIFSNILIDSLGEDAVPICRKDRVKARWTLIDYEWTVPEAVRGDELARRAMFVYASGSERRRCWLFEHEIAQRCGVTEDNLYELQGKENAFQHRVTAGRSSMAELYHRMGQPVIPVMQMVSEKRALEQMQKFQVYEDDGSGFREEASYFPPNAYIDRSHVRLRIYFEQNVNALRLDPANSPCMLYDVKMCVNGRCVYESRPGEKPQSPAADCTVAINGVYAKGGAMVFLTEDPNLTVNMSAMERSARNELTLSAEILFLTSDAAKSLYPDPAGQSAGNLPGIKRRLWRRGSK